MLALENAEEVLQILDRYTKQKSKDIPPELDEYLNYVAKTGDTVYRWPTVQYLFREKLSNVIKEFHDTTASIEELPQCPNVDQFNYETMKTALLERLDHFQSAPFTVQRLCELLTDPKKHYSRLDKFMRALEKNILVVSTVEPGRKPSEIDENGEESLNGDILSDMNIDMDMNKEILKIGEESNGTCTASIDDKDTAVKIIVNDKSISETAIAAACSSSSSSAVDVVITDNGNNSATPATTNEADEHISTEKDLKTEDILDDTVASVTTKDEVKIEESKKDLPDEKDDIKSEAITNEAENSEKTTGDVAATAIEVDDVVVVTNVVKDLPIDCADKAAAADVTELLEEIAPAKDVDMESVKAVENGADSVALNGNDVTIEDAKTDKVLAGESLTAAVVDDVKQEDIKKDNETPEVPMIVVEKPSTPKHARDSDDDDVEEANKDNGRNAKKIKLDLDEHDSSAAEVIDEPTAVANTTPITTTATTIISNDSTVNIEKSVVESKKENEILETVAELIDEEQAKSASNEVENVTAVSEIKEIVSVDSISSEKEVEEDKIEKELMDEIPTKPADVELTETISVTPSDSSDTATPLPLEPLAVETPIINSELDDITPEDALNDLVSSDVLATAATAATVNEIKTDAEESNVVASISEPIIAQDEMNVEENEAATASITTSAITSDIVPAVVEGDAENAMEAAPIKPDDEQMDVDDSNSPDPMDL